MFFQVDRNLNEISGTILAALLLVYICCNIIIILHLAISADAEYKSTQKQDDFNPSAISSYSMEGNLH